MKKFISGFVAGALLFGGVSVFAASSSLIGQRVQGLFAIEKAGVKVADAVVINGSAYAPVRAIADATGTALTVEGKKITMGVETSNAVKIDELNIQRSVIVSKIKDAEGGIRMYESTYIPNAQRNYDDEPSSGSTKNGLAEALAARKSELDKYKAELATLQQQLADLDAQIAALQK